MFIDNLQNNSFLPANINITSDAMSYSIGGKNKNSTLNDFTKNLKQKIKDQKLKEKNKAKEYTNWKVLKPEEVVKKFQEKGYKATNLGNNLYEISRSFQPYDNGRSVTNKMIFNANTGMPETAELYLDDEKIYENILEVKDGKNISYDKFFGREGLRKGKNFLSVREFSGGAIQ